MIDALMTKEAFDQPKLNRPACMTANCGATCSYAYSCHDQRVGRVGHVAWPVFALALLMVIGWLI